MVWKNTSALGAAGAAPAPAPQPAAIAAAQPQQTFAPQQHPVAPPAPMPQMQSPLTSAGPMPAIQQPIAPAPPAAQPAAPAPRRARRTQAQIAADNAAAAAPPAQAAPTPQAPPVQFAQPQAAPSQAVIAQPASTALSAIPVGSFLGQMIANATTPQASALGRLMMVFGGQGGEPNLVPTICSTDTGMFDTDGFNPEGSDADLPVGKDPFYAIFLGYRLKLICWPREFDRTQPVVAPSWTAVISSANPEMYDIAGKALSDHQFTKKELRGQLFGAFGHPTGALELLWWEPQAGLLVTRTQRLLGAMNGTMESLITALPKAADTSGGSVAVLAPFPAEVKPGLPIATNSKGGQKWEEYPIAISQQSTGEGGAVLAAFQQWISGGGYTPDVDGILREWNTTTLTEIQMQTLLSISQAKAGSPRPAR